MNTQQKKLLAIVAVVLFHGAVITVMLAQHGCKSDGSKPSSADTPAPVQPAPVAPPTAMPVAASDNFVEPTHPAPETPLTPTPVAQFSESLATPASMPSTPAAPAPTVAWVVSGGENWTKIAQKNGITVDELVAANTPMTKATVLHPGQSLNVPNHKPTAATPAAMATDSGNTYKVVRGDNLSKIAAKYHTTSKALQALNGLTSTNITAGQILKVPETGTSSAASAPDANNATASVAAATDGSTYTVKSGDSLDKIARSLHVSASDLMSLNGLTDATARNLRPGKVLKLPAGTQAPASPTAAPSTAPTPISVSAVPASSVPPQVTMPVMAVPGSGTGSPPMTPVQ